ncbi:MAG: hypothetical protein Q8R28_17750 [Dehalococcoidia bacterium]|nr:hypothetical protein [Dehalococcoidia bacterium]
MRYRTSRRVHRIRDGWIILSTQRRCQICQRGRQLGQVESQHILICRRSIDSDRSLRADRSGITYRSLRADRSGITYRSLCSDRSGIPDRPLRARRPLASV